MDPPVCIGVGLIQESEVRAEFSSNTDWWKFEKEVGKIVICPILGTFQAFASIETKGMGNNKVPAT